MGRADGSISWERIKLLSQNNGQGKPTVMTNQLQWQEIVVRNKKSELGNHVLKGLPQIYKQSVSPGLGINTWTNFQKNLQRVLRGPLVAEFYL